MAFTFDASALAGKSVVVFEQCYDGERLVAAHADIADADQTVEVYSLPRTGDATDLASASWAAAAGMAMAAIGALSEASLLIIDRLYAEAEPVPALTGKVYGRG